MVCGTLLAVAVLQMKSDQAGKAGAASASCQQGRDRLLKDGDGAACWDQAPVGLERAHGIQICPRVHGHLTQKKKKGNHSYCHRWRKSRCSLPQSSEKPRLSCCNSQD